MNFDWGFDLDYHDLFVGVVWQRGEKPVTTKISETGNHGKPSYGFPIYKVLVVNINPLPCCNFHLEFMWGALV
jgi:hypothetical protein